MPAIRANIQSVAMVVCHSRVPVIKAPINATIFRSFNVCLYPFEEAVAGGADLDTAAENIDIGGPSMVRSAAKAALLYDSVLVVTEPAQYPEVVKTLKENEGEATTEMRRRFALKAFRRTKEYDSAIVCYLEEN